MQGSDNVTLARDIQQYGLSIKQFWLNGYDQKLLDQYSSVMQGVYMSNAGNVPFAAATYPSTYPGMVAYTTAMNKYEPQYTTSNVALAGWQSAALMVEGIRGGRQQHHPGLGGGGDEQDHRLTRQRRPRHRPTGRWPTPRSPTRPAPPSSRSRASSFVSVFAPGKQVFICLGPNAKNPVPVAAAGRHAGGMSRAAVGQD